MKVKIVAVGKIKESFYREAVAEYAKRLSRFCSFEITEVEEKTFKGVPSAGEIDKIIRAEGETVASKSAGYIIALDIEGKQSGSEEIAREIERLQSHYSCVTFVIGGSYGLSDDVKRIANLRMSLGKITLPHQLCRVVLCEQIYRAFTIINNVTYHK
ncbi:MAG: 23S rRNA (pseudouridine(1915)-N(3))-methyltransferase RlmH [Corallococcus sp.]|nr:23S rRNA (pseudouridine(1915)-N(3))-methyltransferase RlmH [Corallococcus sp.]